MPPPPVGLFLSAHLAHGGIEWSEKSFKEGTSSMYANCTCNHNCNYNPCIRGGGWFANYQAFWIIVVIAIVVIWVHYGANAWGGNCCGSLNCGCENDCNPCNPCC